MKSVFRTNISRIILCTFLVVCTIVVSLFTNSIYNRAVAAYVEQPVINDVTQPVIEETTLSAEEIADKSFTVTSPDSVEISVNTPVISFCGVCDLNYPLTINGAAVEIMADGSFSFDINLTPGQNTITVSNSLKTVVYTVTYDMQVISTVSPSKNVRVNGGMVLEISCEALKDSSVSAKINGTTISMTPSDNGGQFIPYYGTYTIPAAQSKDMSLGRVAFYATYNGYTDSKSGGKITVNAYKVEDIYIEQGQGVVKAPEITGDDIVNVLSPNVDHGLGTATMCTVTADYAETVPASTADDKSDPNYTPEIKGMVDYIVGNPVNYDGTDYYILMSGTKVEVKNVSAYQGFVMPTNTISSYKSYTSGGYTNAILTMNWKVPFRSELKQQSYYRGYSGRVFNVSSCTASYIDFTFSYSNAADGSFDFSGSNVVSYAEWVNIGTGGTTTLRVHLRNQGRFYGYRAYYSNDNRLVLSFNEKPSLASAVVVLDPGHGGKDCGAIGKNGTYESTINLRIAAMVKSNLEAAGVKVVILRTNDTYYSLDERQAMARRAGGDIFVSLHNNSSNSSALSGTEVYYYRSFSKSLASSIHSQLASAWRGIYSGNASMASNVVAADGGVRFYPFRVTRIEECPAVLVEGGYLSNATECNKLCDSGVQTALARAVADGIINYFNAQ